MMADRASGRRSEVGVRAALAKSAVEKVVTVIQYWVEKCPVLQPGI